MKSKKQHRIQPDQTRDQSPQRKPSGGGSNDDDFEAWNDWDADELDDIARQFDFNDD